MGGGSSALSAQDDVSAITADARRRLNASTISWPFMTKPRQAPFAHEGGTGEGRSRTCLFLRRVDPRALWLSFHS